MKRLFLTTIASLACLAAFAQGKVNFQNDSTRLVYWGPGWGAISGQAVNSDNMPAGISGMVADLYMGTSSSQLFLYQTTTFSPLSTGPGKILAAQTLANANATTGAPLISSGSVFVEVVVHSNERPSNNTFDPFNAGLFNAWGSSVMFNFTLGTGPTYPLLWNQTAGNWPAGTFNMDQYGSGARGAIMIPSIPEPSVIGLAGLAGAMLIFRRRK